MIMPGRKIVILPGYRELAGKLGRPGMEVGPVEEGEESPWCAREVSPPYDRFYGGENRF